jgi:hydroxymethylbilane synthase
MLKLGTRKSMLAWAQSGWVAREIERLNPGVKVELVGIETRGDRILDVPLQSVAGKEFFVAEIDEALRARAVDLTVHSMKDLSLDRPAEFVLAANPKRENPRDVIVFGPSVLGALRAGRPIRIGTSSPRRLENIPDFLRQALPRVGDRPAEPRLIEIRGNVNTRLSRVQEPEGSERHLDGVVLAFAGLIRLWADEKGRTELERLFQGTRWMVLPLRECPAAPAQGMLAVECRKDDTKTREILAKIHDAASAEQVKTERQLLADWGGGCHQKFGATALRLEGLGELFYIRGRKPDEAFVDELRWLSGPRPQGARPWNGSEWRGSGLEPLSRPGGIQREAIFVAHARAAVPKLLDGKRIWTSGTSSWFKLALQGLWVEGSAEGLGFEELLPTLGEGVLQLPPLSGWAVLTHDRALDGWSDGPGGPEVIATYRVKAEYSAQARQAASQATHFYWSSGSQFDELGALAPQNAHHACGPGKTASYLRTKGIEPKLFPSVEEWKRWI